MNLDQALAYIHRVAMPDVVASGWHVTGHTVDPGELGGNITYTCGLTEAGLHELAVAGLPHDIAAVILNDCARTHLKGRELGLDMRYRTAAGTDVHVIDAPGIPGPMARAMYGNRVCFFQLLWACPHGHFPNFAEWGDDHPRQPVYARPLPADWLPAGGGVVGHKDEVSLRNIRRRMGLQP